MEHDCARPHWPRCSALRAAACARNAVVRSTSQPSTVASRSRAEKNFAKSSSFARIRRASSSWAATVASRAACRAAFVVTPFAMGRYLKPSKTPPAITATYKIPSAAPIRDAATARRWIAFVPTHRPIGPTKGGTSASRKPCC